MGERAALGLKQSIIYPHFNLFSYKITAAGRLKTNNKAGIARCDNSSLFFMVCVPYMYPFVLTVGVTY